MPKLKVIDRPFPAKNSEASRQFQQEVAAAPKSPRLRPKDEPLPESPEIEKAVLCALLYHPDESFSLFAQHGFPELFFSPTNRGWFDQMLKFHTDLGRLDPVEFIQHILDHPQVFTPLGGHVYYVSLQGTCPPAEMIPHYCADLREKYVLREYHRMARSMMRVISTGSLDNLTSYVLRKIDGLQRLTAPNGSLHFSFDELHDFNPKNDPMCLIGNRWLVRGGSTLWAAGAGYGKSALALQLAIYWGCGQTIFGFRPVKPIKSLMIQAENDLGDCAEQMQGVLAGISAIGDLDLEQCKQMIRNNVSIHQVIGKTGFDFLSLFEELIQLERPDVVWIDPFFAFAGCDLMNPEKTGKFLREGLFPVATKRKVGLQVVHHAGKPKTETDQPERAEIDYQYLGFGTSEIQNAFRAVNVLVPADNGTFRLVMSKRGERAGTDSRTIYLQHSTQGICWLEADKPDGSPASEAGRPVKYTKDQLLTYMTTDGVKTAKLYKHLHDELGISSTTFYRLWQELKDDGKIKCDQDEMWYPK
jgi:hypothetical protein